MLFPRNATWPLDSDPVELSWHSSLTRLDLLLIPPLLLLSLLLTLPAALSLLIRTSKPGRKPSPPPSAYVVPAFTRHARFLPRPSAHRFKYNTLYLAVRLDKLERHELDTGHAFAWRGSHYDPEWQDQSTLAEAKLVRSGSGSIAATRADASVSTIATIPEADESISDDASQPTGKPSLDEWKASMRRSERKERRSKEEKRRRIDATTWAITGLHPDSYLRNDFSLPASSAANSQDRQVDTQDPGHQTKAKWLQGSILLKLAFELRERGYLKHGPQDETGMAGNEASWTQELGQVWTVTMPAILGIKGINPLTIHYCYRPGKSLVGLPTAATEDRSERSDALGDFWLVVLEVHNTFSERHVYILESGVNEDGLKGANAESAPTDTNSTRRQGYEHQWTFPRSFHVSPFNDRGGYYRLFLREPFPNGHTADPFVLGVRLLLLVEADAKPAAPDATGTAPLRLEKKLMASLDSFPPSHARRALPLSALHLYAALLRQPLDLFLTFARILFEAGKLHFAKKLDAFGRPDMVQTSESVGQEHTVSWDGRGAPPALNGIQPHRQPKGEDRPSTEPAGGLLYPAHAAAERVAKAHLQRFAQRRVDQLQAEDGGAPWSFRVASTDPADSGIVCRSQSPCEDHTDEVGPTELVLYTRSGGVYTDLLQFSDARTARLARWSADAEPSDRPDAAPSWKAAWIRKVRERHLVWLLGRAIASDASLGPDVASARQLLSQLTRAAPSEAGVHRLDGADPSLSTLSTVLLAHLAAVAEERAFHYLGARYVRGTEPWLELQRGLRLLRDGETQVPRWDTRLGSVRRE